jgi:hypothetical protein
MWLVYKIFVKDYKKEFNKKREWNSVINWYIFRGEKIVNQVGI